MEKRGKEVLNADARLLLSLEMVFSLLGKQKGPSELSQVVSVTSQEFEKGKKATAAFEIESTRRVFGLRTTQQQEMENYPILLSELNKRSF